MKNFCLSSWFCLCFFIPVFGMAVETWRVATVEWPPFICAKCPEGGAAVKLLRRHFHAMGAELKIDIVPWSRALRLGKEPELVGVFPLWRNEFALPTGKDLYASVKVFESALVLIFPIGKKLKWKKLSDLKGYRVGSVQDYGNTTEFNAMIASGDFKSDLSIDEFTNIRKVAAGRVDFAIVDVNVVRYLLATDLKALASKIEIDDRIVEEKTLHMGFNKFHLSRIQRFNQVSKRVRPEDFLNQYFKGTCFPIPKRCAGTAAPLRNREAGTFR